MNELRIGPKICRCGRPMEQRQRSQCRECARRDVHRHGARARKFPMMIVSVDCEGAEDEFGVMRFISVSYGREDGSSGSLSRRYLNGAQVLRWLFKELSGHYTNDKGVEYRQALVSFHFNWDSAMIARDFPEESSILVHKATARKRNLLCWTVHKPEQECKKIHRRDLNAITTIISDGGESDVIAWEPESQLGIAMTPRRRFYSEYRPEGDRFERNLRLDIHDVGGSFTGSLLTVISDWNPELTPEQFAIIEWGKAARKGKIFDTAPIEQIEQYSEAECIALARTVRLLLDNIRDAAHIIINPSKVFGAGSIASSVFKHHHVSTRKETQIERRVIGTKADKIAIDDIPQMTYFGGMIEGPVIGALDYPVDEVDINSAYPARMVTLPCMRDGHGQWKRRHGYWESGTAPKGAIGHVLATWAVNTLSTPPFMVRDTKGSVYQPQLGKRVWVTLDEFHAAYDHFPQGSIIPVETIWWIPECDCELPFSWAAELYEARLNIKLEMRTVEKFTPEWWSLYCRQLSIKLILNSCYGKLAQRKHGGGPYTNLHYASAITGATRAKVRIETWAQEARGGTVVYQHTDSVSSIGGNPIDGGASLGAWGLEKQSIGFVIAQPGLAISLGEGKAATRGVSKDEFRAAIETFVNTVDMTTFPLTWPIITIAGTQMISRRMAIHRGKPWLAGSFVDRPLSVRIATGKRDMRGAVQVPGNARAWALPPVMVVRDPATLDDVRVQREAIERLFGEGEYDDDLGDYGELDDG